MRRMVLSMQPFWLDKVINGDKIFEYRNRFPDEKIMAYVYVSSPIQAIEGVLILGERIELSRWEENYKNDDDVLDRILRYKERKNKYAMPILSYYRIEPITLGFLRKELPKFIIPQSYYLEETELIKVIQKYEIAYGEVGTHKFEGINKKDICKNYHLV